MNSDITDDFLLIADSGSTKTDWALGQLRVSTQGMNPIHMTDAALLGVLQGELLPQLAGRCVTRVVFYGSGVRPDQQQRMARLLLQALPQASTAEAHSDMLGAARALCGHQAGLACILGTGANSCLFDGRDIVANVPPLGYVLGDEGSGAVMGRNFLNALLRNQLYAGALQEFERETGLTMATVIDRVYRQPLPNRFLASLAPYVHARLHHAEVHRLVVGGFRRFIALNLAPYRRPDLAVGAVGSIAHFFRQEWAEALAAEGYSPGAVLRSPIGALAAWHR